ncbi:MAG TPA: glycosyltransferase family 39 protein [Polyangia bacterium]|nr:glycosyltransferase family 39 protein [Polyangia bacterium]
MPPDPSAVRRAPVVEVVLAAAALIFFAWLGAITGWKGAPKTAISTAVWPFYFDTWFPQAVWTWRALAPAAAFALAWWPLRQFAAGDRRPWIFAALVAGAYAVHLGCGIERHGVERGLSFTFSRGQEYWNDVHWVGAGFLARFPEVGGRLSQHGATHPPGLVLVLAAIVALGAKSRVAAELACSFACVLAALPLYGAARRLTDETTARFATILFLFACSVTAFAVLAMDSVTMLLAALALYGLARALDGDALGGALWGLALAAATLCTLTAFTLGLTYAVVIAARWSELRADRRRWLALALGPAAFLGFYGVLALGFGYRPFHVFDFCWRAFAASDDARRSPAIALVGNPVAFLGSLGLPLTALCARSIAGAARRLARRTEFSTAMATVALVLAAALPPAVCTLMGKPRAEVERIYLLFVPPMALAAAACARRWYARDERWLTWFAAPLLVAQSILVEIFFETMW